MKTINHQASIRTSMIRQSANRAADGLRRVCLISLAIMFASPFCANAQSGTITFVGAVVAPTCQPAPPQPMQHVPATLSDQSCGSAKAGTVRSYQLSTTPIAANTGDRVLSYFYGYTTSASARQAPVLMTLEYE